MDKFIKEKDELLIDLVRCNTVLYDASDKHYKNNIVKHKVWENISETLDVPVSDVKKRWKHFRDHYKKKKKADKGTRSQNNWEYMSLLTFLSQAPSQHRKSIKKEATNETIYLETDETEEFPETLQKEATDSCQSDHNTENEIVFAQNINNSCSASEGPSRGRKRKSSSNMLTTILEKGQDERAASYGKLCNQETTTAMKKFFESMADIVSQFPPHLAAEARLKVCQVVTDIEIRMHSEHTGRSSPASSSSEDSNT